MTKKQLIESAITKIVKRCLKENTRDNIIAVFSELGGFDSGDGNLVTKEYGKEIDHVERALSATPVNWRSIFDIVGATTTADKRLVQSKLSGLTKGQ